MVAEAQVKAREEMSIAQVRMRFSRRCRNENEVMDPPAVMASSFT